jgi:cation:H+ antiporter
MNILLNVVLLLVGFVALIKGADFFVEGSAAVAKKLHVPGVIIGLTIVAMGTSAPELAVSISAGLTGSNEIAISNVIGSNIFNLIVVLGVCAVMAPVAVDKSIMKRDFPFSIAITLLLAVFISDMILTGKSVITDTQARAGGISRWEALIFIILFAVYILITVRSAIKNRQTQQEEIEDMSGIKCAVYILGGIAAVVIGGQLVVNSAREIALFCGMSETLVGLTIVAIGTSLPELVTSIVASSKGQNGMAVGNVVGSNIFNILLILGVSSFIHPISAGMFSLIDICILLVMNVCVFIFATTGKKINRYEGAAMVLMYVAYTAYAIIR